MGRRTGITQRLTGQRCLLWAVAAWSILAIVSGDDFQSPLESQEPEFVVPVLDPVEEWHYEWKTSGLLKILFPNSGVGALRLEAPVDGLLRAELRIDAADDVYWLTGSLIEADTLTVREIWTEYQWHGRVRTRLREVQREGVVDMLATILTLRRDLPNRDTPLDFQAGSTVYPIVARRQPEEPAYHLQDRDSNRGERWNKRAEVGFAPDADRSPRHIALIETLIRVDLVLVNGE